MLPGEYGKDKGKEYATIFEAWLSKQASLPGQAGKPNKAEIARLAGIGDRKRFYDNPACIMLLKNCKLPVVDSDGSDAEKSKLENKIEQMETQLVNSEAEKAELRRKLRKLQHIEQIMESGGRFIP